MTNDFFKKQFLIKNLILLCVFTVHYSTRTSLFYLYCLSVCFVVVGPNSVFTTLAYLWTFAVLSMSFFLVLLFNLKFCKSWAINLVGVKNFSEYVSHSYPGVKSLATALGVFIGIRSLENGSARAYARIHFEQTAGMQAQVKDLRDKGEHDRADVIQSSINKINEDFVPEGLLSRGFASGGIYFGIKPRANPICSPDDTKNVLFKNDI